MPVRLLPLVLLTVAPAFAQSRLLGVQSDGVSEQLVRIDEGTAAATTIGPLGFASDGLAHAPGGRLLAADKDQSQLVELDPFTAGSTPVGPFNIGTHVIEGMAFHPVTGELWGINVVADELVRIDDVTGDVTVVGSVGAPPSLAAITWSSDGGTLFAMDFAEGSLYTLDPATGLASLVGTGPGASAGGPLGMAADPLTGELYVAEWRGGADMTLAIVDPGTGARTPVGTMVGYSQIEGLTFGGEGAGGPGSTYCAPAVSNSTGGPASLGAFGSDVASDNQLALFASGMPANQFGYFLAARSQGFFPNAGGSQGNLCLVLPIVRFAQSILSSGANGSFNLQVDLTAIPTTPVSAVVAGDTWSFQCWYRDVNPGPTSNFTNGVSVSFQ